MITFALSAGMALLASQGLILEGGGVGWLWVLSMLVDIGCVGIVAGAYVAGKGYQYQNQYYPKANVK